MTTTSMRTWGLKDCERMVRKGMHRGSLHQWPQTLQIMKKTGDGSWETRETGGASGPERPSCSTYATSLSSVFSLSKELGYQGSQELSSEDNADLNRFKRRKRNKMAVLRMKRNEMQEEDDEEGTGPPSASQPPRFVRKQRTVSGSPQLAPQEEVPVVASSSSSSSRGSQLSCWSLATFRYYLCSCCVEGDGAPRSRGNRSPRHPEAPLMGAGPKPPGAPQGTPREDLGQKHRGQ